MMPLNPQHQRQILMDIMQNHLTDQCGSVSECQQMQRLAKSLVGNDKTDEQLKTLLHEIYEYSQKGAGTKDLNAHIQQHSPNLNQWLGTLQQYDTPFR
ncbi:YtzH-like family protein [Bacillus tianshenii]|nr:YtzH-like family protein [Bacillus tianshenii]